MNERQQRFIDLLHQIFEIDKSDLDFGIYRILNIRKKEIEDFFKNELPQQITDILEPFATGDKEAIRQKMATIEQQAAAFNASPENNPEYNNLKTQLQQGTDIAALENDVYSALYTFFNSYYDEGDFISKRRYKDGKYAIPYEGEEVKLYWANQDQYYIKTSENFKDYSFKADGYTVHFRLVDATTEQNNNKEADDKKRKFMIFTEDEENYPGIKTFEQNEITDKDGNVVDSELIIRFVFDVPQDSKAKYDEINFNAIRDYLAKQGDTQLMRALLRIINRTAKKNDQITLIQKHLKGYVAKNTFDYFIHKDLGGFLTRELDFFIKNEVMHLDDIDTDNEKSVNTYLAKVRAIKRVGKTIIDFLAQIENFQKKLWLKKKFVVETNWCITLDRIDEKFYDEIRNNKAQVQEWIDMYAIDELVTDLEHTEPFTEVPSITFLKQNKNLIVDTKHFSDEFKNKLIASIDDLDENTGGLMINSDNYQALSLLQKRYSKKIDTIYIDPPYNSPSSEVMYKNSYKHSAWLSLMNDRLSLANTLRTNIGSYSIAIDKYEHNWLYDLCKQLFSEEDVVSVAIEHNKKGTQGEHFSYNNEYAIFVISHCLKNLNEKIRPESEWDYSQFRNWGSESERSDAANCFYPVYVQNDEVVGYGDVLLEDANPSSSNEKITNNISVHTPNLTEKVIIEASEETPVIAVWPIDDANIQRKWRYAFQSIGEIYSYLKVETSKSGIKQIKMPKYSDQFKTLWYNSLYNAGDYGTKVLSSMGFSKEMFEYPKSIHTVYDCIYAISQKDSIVIDFFAGSATTAQSIRMLNNYDQGNRKYILVEMGNYFSTVSKPRAKKVAYSLGWSDGKPTTRNTGISHIMKYLRLESYEDALSNISLQEQVGFANLLGDEYLINYMLDLEAKDSLLNVKAFTTPFDYEMKITENNECKQQRVDVCETFNYLIGLTVVHQGEIRSFNSKPANEPKYEGAVDLEISKTGNYTFRQIEGTVLDVDGSKKNVLIIWRNITENILDSNAALDAYFEKYRINPQNREYDIIYVNGDNNLENLRKDDETWKVVMTEIEFNKRMFEEV